MSFTESWFEEKQSAWLYRVVAACEPNPVRSRLFAELAQAADGQAQTWAAKLAEAGAETPRFRPTARARLVARLVRRLGPRRMRPVLAAMKVRGMSVYLAPGAPRHHPMPQSVEEVGERHQGRGGGNLRAAVFGVNDGLVSNAALIMGVAGAGSEVAFIITTGVAGLLAGALSMAAGEYISVRSQREMFEYQIGLEREELAEYPEEEAEELALIYAARGMDIEAARQVTGAMMQDPEHALDVLAREELGLNPDDLGSPWGAALFSFLSFTGGALIPLLPFLLGLGAGRGVLTAALLTGLSLLGVGAALSLFTGRNAVLGGLRMLLIGGGAGLTTYLIGRLLGVGLA